MLLSQNISSDDFLVSVLKFLKWMKIFYFSKQKLFACKDLLNTLYFIKTHYTCMQAENIFCPFRVCLLFILQKSALSENCRTQLQFWINRNQIIVLKKSLLIFFVKQVLTWKLLADCSLVCSSLVEKKYNQTDEHKQIWLK